jgi:flagellar basal-body rod protein FlgC
MNVISANLANAQTTRTPEGGPYQRRDVVFAAVALPSSFRDVLQDALDKGVAEVRVVEIATDPRPPKMVYNPSHPDADASGYVALPSVNIVEEMVNMLSASRSYEANVTAIQAAKGMALKALEIAR